jgi:hypothetical protein
VPGVDAAHARAAAFLQAFRDAGYTGAIASLPNPGGNRAGKPARISLQEQDLAALLQHTVPAEQKENASV